MLKGQGTFNGGVSRRFLGLTAKHAYRVSARLNTLATGDGDWTFTFHAVANAVNGEALKANQMAGAATLPDGSTGSMAGQIARFDGGHTTKDKWVTRHSGEKTSDNAAGNITLPSGCDSITLWFRLAGQSTNEVTVGLDSVTIEDLGVQN